jgi:hypothetical protein
MVAAVLIPGTLTPAPRKADAGYDIGATLVGSTPCCPVSREGQASTLPTG